MVRVVGVAAGLVIAASSGHVSAQVAPAAPEAVAIGDWRVAPIVEVRVRGEYSRDFDARDRGLLVERARLGVDVARGAVAARVVLQDARAWDTAGGTGRIGGPTPLASTGAYEAWGEAHTDSVHPSFVRVGRQEVQWGEGRLLGVADWSPAGRTLDALRGRLVIRNAAFELLAVSLSEPTGGAPATYGELAGARVEWSFDPLFAVEGYGLARLVQSDPAQDLEATVRGQTYTGALRLHGEAHAWTWGVEGAYQLGHVDVLVEDRSAWAAAAHLGHTFEGAMFLPSAVVGVSYASGDRGGSTYRAFDPILPDVHAWHGAMDVFSWSNEEEASARVAVVPWADAAAFVEYRYARLAEAGGAWRSAYLTTIGHSPASTQSDLGHEIDAVLTWSPWVPIDLVAGYSALVVGEGARAALSASQVSNVPGVVHFAYAQATLRLP